MKILAIPGILFTILLIGCIGNNPELSSPNEEITANVFLDENGSVYYSVSLDDKQVIKKSKLGIVRDDEDFSKNMKMISISGTEEVIDEYSLLSGKQKDVVYEANKKVYHLENESGAKMDVIFQLSDDGVAFRYYFPEESTEVKMINDEMTSYTFPENTTAWIQPMAEAKSGWERTNPSYEEDYIQNVRLDTLRTSKPGWVYPVLFNTGDIWVLISETAPYRNYCGTRLKHLSGTYEFEIDFPSQKETLNEESGANPGSSLPWYTPWRIITIGSDLGVINGSTLGTDLAKPNLLEDITFVKPGRASWSWVMLKDDSIVYTVQKRFIDYAAEMGWEYSLIDVNWNNNIGIDSIKTLADYAAKKNVGLILWYNSAGSWNTAPYQPRGKFLTQESREKEFAWLHEVGIKGVKVDFFGGDGQDVMGYYLDIIETAAKYKMMVNTHGCTLPRGWQRTYPNLVTMEAVRGEEFCTFTPEAAYNQPTHCCVLPFTRNVFDPMDFTPVVFQEIPFKDNGIEDARMTTNAFELALSVIFLSGIQHYAETDIGIKKVPEFVKKYLHEIPVSWDESKFIDGYPGKLFVIARKTGDTWYVAGINGENEDKFLHIDLSFIDAEEGELVRDRTKREMTQEPLEMDDAKTALIDLMPYGGFIMKFKE